eukprot:TRINITY_DN4212_c0_g1::TRINITY_DN4212_c0_g1_i1::g.7904::m.7904 TRINITY_DN4212_c0_g1::TRINITY_DN4212_c0_g1_i1::g.7904  ORF type:complete len:502 (-),score=114.93,sp/Q6GQ29/CBPQ_XENLA/44.39/2e-116,Peptidase_M28/PF04389.12/7.4e-14,Peptidase_M20/PF01546.23/3.9e-07 TRINITY_DN4212_c0_g1_i1:165-1604(-)
MLRAASVCFSFLICIQGLSAFPVSDEERFVDIALQESETYERVGYIADTFGPRLCNSQNLRDAISWIAKTMEGDGLDAVYTEEVNVPNWIRGKEYLKMLEPRETDLQVLALGASTGTKGKVIQAEVLVVNSFDELRDRASKGEVTGKIVVYNVPFTTYGNTVSYRSSGAIEAEKYGAVASLTRSVTPFSLNSVHTGSSTPASIAAGAITVEDAEMLQRFQDRGQRTVLELYMEAHMDGTVVSHNVVAELKGTDLADEIVIMGGHVDSWDIGTGVADDLGGAVIGWEALRLMAKHGIRPRRTIRAVLWTAEEEGGVGGDAYFYQHEHELSNVVFAMECDLGTFTPWGVGFTGSQNAYDVLKALGTSGPLAQIGAGNSTFGGGVGVDIELWCNHGVPCAHLDTLDPITGLRDDTGYFYYHHSAGDTMSIATREDLSLCTAAMGSWALQVANLDHALPRTVVQPRSAEAKQSRHDQNAIVIN